MDEDQFKILNTWNEKSNLVLLTFQKSQKKISIFKLPFGYKDSTLPPEIFSLNNAKFENLSKNQCAYFNGILLIISSTIESWKGIGSIFVIDINERKHFEKDLKDIWPIKYDTKQSLYVIDSNCTFNQIFFSPDPTVAYMIYSTKTKTKTDFVFSKIQISHFSLNPQKTGKLSISSSTPISFCSDFHFSYMNKNNVIHYGTIAQNEKKEKKENCNLKGIQEMKILSKDFVLILQSSGNSENLIFHQLSCESENPQEESTEEKQDSFTLSNIATNFLNYDSHSELYHLFGFSKNFIPQNSNIIQFLLPENPNEQNEQIMQLNKAFQSEIFYPFFIHSNVNLINSLTFNAINLDGKDKIESCLYSPLDKISISISQNLLSSQRFLILEPEVNSSIFFNKTERNEKEFEKTCKKAFQENRMKNSNVLSSLRMFPLNPISIFSLISNGSENDSNLLSQLVGAKFISAPPATLSMASSFIPLIDPLSLDADKPCVEISKQIINEVAIVGLYFSTKITQPSNLRFNLTKQAFKSSLYCSRIIIISFVSYDEIMAFFTELSEEEDNNHYPNQIPQIAVLCQGVFCSAKDEMEYANIEKEFEKDLDSIFQRRNVTKKSFR